MGRDVTVIAWRSRVSMAAVDDGRSGGREPPEMEERMAGRGRHGDSSAKPR
jgi:hypothetical protein